jgi:transposase
MDQHRDNRGLNRCLRAIGLPKSTYYYRQKRPDKPSEEEQKLMSQVREIIQEHPEYGYRRILPELEERTGRTVNHKRLRRLLSEHELALPRQMPKRSPSRGKDPGGGLRQPQPRGRPGACSLGGLFN